MICQLHTKFQNIFGELPYNFRLVDDSDLYNRGLSHGEAVR